MEATENWLLMIDTLDDINIADGCLRRDGGYTLITTRNRNSDGISTEELEDSVMDLRYLYSVFL